MYYDKVLLTSCLLVSYTKTGNHPVSLPSSHQVNQAYNHPSSLVASLQVNHRNIHNCRLPVRQVRIYRRLLVNVYHVRRVPTAPSQARRYALHVLVRPRV